LFFFITEQPTRLRSASEDRLFFVLHAVIPETRFKQKPTGATIVAHQTRGMQEGGEAPSPPNFFDAGKPFSLFLWTLRQTNVAYDFIF